MKLCDFYEKCSVHRDREDYKCDECVRNFWLKKGKFYEDWYNEL